MATEIERKFLVRSGEWKTDPGRQSSTRICQGYLCREPGRTVRVRVAGEKAYLTIKGAAAGLARPEFEYDIPVADAEQLLRLCDGPTIDKTRHVIDHLGTLWEVDEFHGANAKLIVAEVELDREDEPFASPPWLGAEVTSDYRYTNSNLSRRPYSTW